MIIQIHVVLINTGADIFQTPACVRELSDYKSILIVGQFEVSV